MRGKDPIEADAIVKILNGRRSKRMTVYTGDYVDISLDLKDYKNYRICSILLIAVIAISHIGIGFMNNPGMYEFFVAIPYVTALISLGFFILSLFQMPREKNKFRLGEVELLFKRMRLSSILLVISLGLTILGELFIILNLSIGDPLALDTIFLALEAFGATVALLLIRTQIRITKKISVE